MNHYETRSNLSRILVCLLLIAFWGSIARAGGRLVPTSPRASSLVPTTSRISRIFSSKAPAGVILLFSTTSHCRKRRKRTSIGSIATSCSTAPLCCGATTITCGLSSPRTIFFTELVNQYMATCFPDKQQFRPSPQ